MATKKRTTKKSIAKIVEEQLKADLLRPLTNRVAFILDVSSSMGGCINEAHRQLQANLNNVRNLAAQTGQKTLVSFYAFGSYARCVFRDVPVESCTSLPFVGADGMTALCDGVCMAINDGRAAPDANDKNTSFLLYCATDGAENQSRNFNATMMAQLIRSVQQTDRWTFGFMVPRGSKSHMVNNLGIPEGNVIEWENTVTGARDAFIQTLAATNNFYGARSVGATKSVKLYDTTDLSKLSKADLTQKLDDLSHKFKSVTVGAEQDIKSFAEGVTQKPYVLGSLYYALTKREKVQASKEVLIVEKGKKQVYGGTQARSLIGIHTGVDVMVTPGNHANYDVYVKSTSVNRKLVRGTKVLIDITKVIPDKETWDSAAAIAAAEAKKAAAQTTSQP